jgi:hypothetical protein
LTPIKHKAVFVEVVPSTHGDLPMVLYSIYWVFWEGVQEKEVKKGETVAISLQTVSSLILSA